MVKWCCGINDFCDRKEQLLRRQQYESCAAQMKYGLVKKGITNNE